MQEKLDDLNIAEEDVETPRGFQLVDMTSLYDVNKFTPHYMNVYEGWEGGDDVAPSKHEKLLEQQYKSSEFSQVCCKYCFHEIN